MATRNPNIRYQIQETVRARIVNLTYPPGAPISENDLAAQMGVSRTPVREALLRLAEDQLVEVIPRVGTFVKLIDLTIVRESQFLREAIEIASLRSLNLPLTREQIAPIEANLDEQEIAVREGDTERFFGLDEAFHRGLMEIGGHGFSWSVVDSAKAHLDRARVLGFQEVSPIDYFYRQHREIFEALTGNDAERTAALLREHLRAVLNDVKHVTELLPELFSNDAGAAPTETAPVTLSPAMLRDLAKARQAARGEG